MIKLDNRGWGYAMFFFFMGVLFIALIMVVYMVNDFESGISREGNKNLSYSQLQRYKRYEREVASSALNYSKVHGVVNRINISKLDVDYDVRSECTGYALYNYSEMKYFAFLKCGNYQSEGYAN